MSNKFRTMAAGLAAACFLTSFAGCVAVNRTPQGTTPQGVTPGTITRQGRNLSQELTRGTYPNTMMPGTGYGNLTTNQGATTAPGGITTAPGGVNMQPSAFDVQKADNIVNKVGNIDGCRNVNAIVNGNTALVSYTPSRTMRNKAATESAIVKRVKALDRTISNVVVTESADIMNSMTRLSNDIKSNKVGSNLNNTFNQLVRKVKGS